ncbi:hypothetical protein JOC36_001456 [Weissella uvarum]|nr:hypothetical protein [Weissella uvarum]MBM7617863.1 hypothetical protein [Weissella uvarum]
MKKLKADYAKYKMPSMKRQLIINFSILVGLVSTVAVIWVVGGL